MFTTKVLTEDTQFSRLLSVKTGPPRYVFIWAQDGLAFYMGMTYKNTQWPSLSYSKTLSIGPASRMDLLRY